MKIQSLKTALTSPLLRKWGSSANTEEPNTGLMIYQLRNGAEIHVRTTFYEYYSISASLFYNNIYALLYENEIDHPNLKRDKFVLHEDLYKLMNDRINERY